MIKDSGERREFDTEAVRDIQSNKGREDLLPIKQVAELLDCEFLKNIAFFQETGNTKHLEAALVVLSRTVFPDIHTMILETAIHMEEGAMKYSERNWQKGIPIHCFMDSGIRHYLKYARGDNDERHDRACVWNVLCALWTLENKPELNDFTYDKLEI